MQTYVDPVTLAAAQPDKAATQLANAAPKPQPANYATRRVFL